MPQLKELKIYVTEGLYARIQDECAKCECRVSPFVRLAITKELIYRQRNRAKDAPAAPLTGQQVIPGVD